MRIILSDFMILDGIVQAPGGKEEDTDGGFRHGGWSMPHFDPASMGVVIGEVMARTEALLFGRRTCWCVDLEALVGQRAAAHAIARHRHGDQVVSGSEAAQLEEVVELADPLDQCAAIRDGLVERRVARGVNERDQPARPVARDEFEVRIRRGAERARIGFAPAVLADRQMIERALALDCGVGLNQRIRQQPRGRQVDYATPIAMAAPQAPITAGTATRRDAFADLAPLHSRLIDDWTHRNGKGASNHVRIHSDPHDVRNVATASPIASAGGIAQRAVSAGSPRRAREQRWISNKNAAQIGVTALPNAAAIGCAAASDRVRSRRTAS